ncbi:Peritrophin-1 [Formica fusca]
MKGIYVIAIAFLAFWSVCTANENQQFIQETGPLDNIVRECPFTDPRNTTIHLAHESDCTKFYKCLAGRGIEQLCPLMWPDDPYKRLHFNRALQVCDWPGQAGCQVCPEPDVNGNYPPESWIADPDSRDCRGYIICKNGRRQRGTCPSGQCFSRTCQGCVKNPKGGNCEGGPIVTTTTTSTTTSTTTTKTTPICETNDLKRHDCDCSKYHKCNNNQVWGDPIQCDGGLHFNHGTPFCHPPDEADCPFITKN